MSKMKNEWHLNQMQDVDYFEINDWVDIALGSIRDADSKKYDQANQDYLALKVHQNYICFVVCDGVSQSFFGNWAAKYLGDHLIEWINSYVNRNSINKSIAEDLTMFLDQMAIEGKDVIDNMDLTDDVPDYLISILDERKRFGSETMFVIGLLEFPINDKEKGKMFLASCGDIIVRLWDDRTEITNKLGLRTETSHRWSSHKGLVGGFTNLVVKEIERNDLKRILVYSDGCPELNEIKNPDNIMDPLLKQISCVPRKDDSTFISLTFNRLRDGK